MEKMAGSISNSSEPMPSTPSFRSLILIILTCCSLCDSQAQQGPDSVVFRKETITRLLHMPQHAGKLFFVDVSGEWCAPCKMMDRTTFRDSAVANFFNTHFISKRLMSGRTYTDPVSRRLLAMHDYVPNFFFLDQQGTVAYLHLTPETDNYTDSIIGLMIEYESALDGKAYLFMSAAANQSLATARTHIPDLGYRMYAACIGLVSQKSNYAIQTRNKALLRRCEQENLRVYQDKALAKKINAKMEEYFGKNE